MNTLKDVGVTIPASIRKRKKKTARIKEAGG